MSAVPRVSVVMAVYNNREDLPQALESLAAQTLQDFELIAVDDGSTDGSGELLNEYAQRDARVRVIHQANTGLGPALRIGCDAAIAPYLARQDADDVSLTTRLQRQWDYMERRREVVVSGTWTRFVTPAGDPVASLEVPDESALLLRLLESGDNPLVHGSVMIRADAYRREGRGYRLRRYCEEYDLWLRLSAFGTFGCLPSVEYLYRMSEGGMSFGNMTSRLALRALCLQLHAERKRLGREQTDWRAAEMAVLEAAPAEHDPVQRRTGVAYAAALQALGRGDWRGYHRRLDEARRGKGPLARKAQHQWRARWAWPLTRVAYRLADMRTARRYLRPLRSDEAP